MEHTLSPDASPADGDRRATLKRPAAARQALREAIRRDESDRREAEASVREEEAAQEAADTLVATVSKNASEVSLASAETRSPPPPRAAEPVPAR